MNYHERPLFQRSFYLPIALIRACTVAICGNVLESQEVI